MQFIKLLESGGTLICNGHSVNIWKCFRVMTDKLIQLPHDCN
jgi:hypothetical protein